MITPATHRETKYCNAIRLALNMTGHATNSELLALLRHDFPELSATTVHRATARLAERGEIGIAPTNNHGATRYDARAEPHDHFSCTVCDRLCDASLREKLLPIITETVRDCSISGSIVLTGVCNSCAAIRN